MVWIRPVLLFAKRISDRMMNNVIEKFDVKINETTRKRGNQNIESLNLVSKKTYQNALEHEAKHENWIF